MKSFWSLVTTLAIAHAIALAGVVAWLVFTGRLNLERVERIREMIGETIEEERARLETEAKASEDAQREANAAAAASVLPLGAADRVRLKLELSEIDRQQLLRMQREMRDLQLGLQRERDLLDRETEAFEQEKADFEAWRAQLMEIEGADQFKKTLATYEGMKSKDAKASLSALLDLGEKDQVVSYLSAMDERIRTKIITEFNREDPAVAADLLESIRTRATEMRAAGDPSG